MVSADILNELFYYKDGVLYGKYSNLRRKESNTRVIDKPIGCPMGTGHLICGVKIGDIKYKLLVHRIIWAMHYGTWPEFIDHIDRNPQNNHIENLREADKRLNSINRGLQKNNTSGVRGIHKYGPYWQAYITNHNKRVYLGNFKCVAKAIKARLEAEKKYWHDVRTNEVAT